METTKSTGVNSLSNLKGRAAHTAKRIVNAMNEDTDAAMCHTFAALTDGAKAIALQAGHYSNTYIRGNANGMDVTAAAQELEAKAAANVTRKLRKIDHAAAVAFLAEYISRQRNEVAKETTTVTAPKFEELTHAATNIVLTAENDGDIYRRYVETLIGSLAKKVAKGVQLNASTLAASSVVANIIRESIKGMKSSGWSNPVTASDRKQAAAYLANAYISDAIENAEYLNA